METRDALTAERRDGNSAMDGLLELAGEPFELDESMEGHALRWLQASDGPESSTERPALSQRAARTNSTGEAPKTAQSIPSSAGSEGRSFRFPPAHKEIEVQVWTSSLEAAEIEGKKSPGLSCEAGKSATVQMRSSGKKSEDGPGQKAHKMMSDAQKQHLQSLRNRFHRSRSIEDSRKKDFSGTSQSRQQPNEEQPAPTKAEQPRKSAWRPNGPLQRHKAGNSGQGISRQLQKGVSEPPGPVSNSPSGSVTGHESMPIFTTFDVPTLPGTELHQPHSEDAHPKASQLTASSISNDGNPQLSHIPMLPSQLESGPTHGEAGSYQSHIQAARGHLVADMESRLQEVHELRDRQQKSMARQEVILQQRLAAASQREQKLDLLASRGALLEPFHKQSITNMPANANPNSEPVPAESSQVFIELARALQEMKAAAAEVGPGTSAAALRSQQGTNLHRIIQEHERLNTHAEASGKADFDNLPFSKVQEIAKNLDVQQQQLKAPQHPTNILCARNPGKLQIPDDQTQHADAIPEQDAAANSFCRRSPLTHPVPSNVAADLQPAATEAASRDSAAARTGVGPTSLRATVPCRPGPPQYFHDLSEGNQSGILFSSWSEKRRAAQDDSSLIGLSGDSSGHDDLSIMLCRQRAAEAPAGLKQLRAAVVEDAEVGRAALQRWDSHHSSLVSALCSAAVQVPKGIMSAILEAMEGMDWDVRQLCSRACANEQRLQAITREVLVMRHEANVASKQVQDYTSRVNDLQEQLRQAQKVNKDQKERCNHWQQQARVSAEHAASAGRRADGVGDDTLALQKENQELAEKIKMLEDRVVKEEEAKKEMQEFAEQEATSSRELLDKMEEALQSYRREALVEEAEIAQKRIDAEAAVAQALEIQGNLAMKMSVLGTSWHLRGFKARSARILHRWSGFAKRRLVLRAALARGVLRHQLMSTRQVFGSWKAASQLSTSRQRVIIGALILGSEPAILPHEYSYSFYQGLLAEVGRRSPRAQSPIQSVWMVSVFRAWQKMLLAKESTMNVASRQAQCVRKIRAASILRAWNRWVAETIRLRHLLFWWQAKADKQATRAALLAWQELARMAGVKRKSVLLSKDISVMAGHCIAQARADAESESVHKALTWRARRLLRGWLRLSHASAISWEYSVAMLSERFLVRRSGLLFMAWLGLSKETSCRLAQVNRALSWRQRRLVEGCWKCWRTAAIRATALDFDSRTFRLYRLLSSCLHAWRHLSVGAVRLRLLEKAMAYCGTSQAVADVFEAWRHVVLQFIEGRIRLERACRRVSHVLLAACFNSWADYRPRRNAQAAVLHRIAARREAYIAQEAFKTWRTWLGIRDVQHRRLQLLTERRQSGLLLLVLYAWKHGVQRRKIIKADVARNWARLQRRLAASVFRSWFGFTRQHKAWILHTVREQAAIVMLGAAFRGWVLQAVGAHESRMHVILSCWSAWKQDSEASRLVRQKGREHALLCLEQALQRIANRRVSCVFADSFGGWHSVVCSSLALRRRLHVYKGRLAAACAKRSLNGWKVVCQNKSFARAIAAQSMAKVGLRVMRQVVSIWRAVVVERRHNEALIRSCLIPRLRHIKADVLREWFLQVELRSVKVLGSERLLADKFRRLIFNAFQAWCSVVNQKAAESIKEQLAGMMQIRLQVYRLGSIVINWQKWAARQSELQALQCQAYSILCKRLLKGAFAAWRAGSEALAALREAVLCRVGREALVKWRRNVKEYQRERLLAQCSGALEEHSRERLLASAFGAWQQAWRVSLVWGLRPDRAQEARLQKDRTASGYVQAVMPLRPRNSPRQVANKKTGSTSPLPLRGHKHPLVDSGLDDRRRIHAKQGVRDCNPAEAVIHRVPTTTPTRKPFQEVSDDSLRKHQLFSELASLLLQQQSVVEDVKKGAGAVCDETGAACTITKRRVTEKQGAGGRQKIAKRQGVAKMPGQRTIKQGSAGSKSRRI